MSGHAIELDRLYETRGFDIEAWDSLDSAALICSAESEHDAVVRLLLEKGAAVDLIDKSGWSGFQLRVPDRATYLLYHDNTADITTDKLLPPGFESHQYQHWVRK